MRNEEEIRQLRDEVRNWMDLAEKAPMIMSNPSVVKFLVTVHDLLTWTLGQEPGKTELGIGLESTLSSLREAMKDVADKQHKHRNPTLN